MRKKVVSPPHRCEGNNQDLNLESTLQELPLYTFSVESICPGIDVAHLFEQYPRLPGVILLAQDQWIGMISRQRMLEYLLHPHGREIFLNEPLQVLYSYARTEILMLPDSTPILSAAHQALRRSPELLGEPIVVQGEANQYQLLNIHDLNIAYWQIRGIETQVRYERSQVQMIQSEKMASLGRLVDGLAHEILDPVNFIWGNLTYISSYSEGLLNLIATYEKSLPQISEEIIELKQKIEFDFLQEDLSKAIGSIKTGADRLKKLVTSLQNFCHVDDIYPKPADLNANLESIVLLLESRLTSEIEIIKNYGLLPPITCYIGQMNQVFMNILSNAVNVLLNQAISQKLVQEFKGKEQRYQIRKPQIEITTKVCSLDSLENSDSSKSRWVSIIIADNGPGLSPEAKRQLVESFSVEERAIKETSLAMSYRIVTAKHGGKFKLRSPSIIANEYQFYSGTEFEIILPLV